MEILVVVVVRVVVVVGSSSNGGWDCTVSRGIFFPGAPLLSQLGALPIVKHWIHFIFVVMFGELIAQRRDAIPAMALGSALVVCLQTGALNAEPQGQRLGVTIIISSKGFFERD